MEEEPNIIDLFMAAVNENTKKVKIEITDITYIDGHKSEIVNNIIWESDNEPVE